MQRVTHILSEVNEALTTIKSFEFIRKVTEYAKNEDPYIEEREVEIDRQEQSEQKGNRGAAASVMVGGPKNFKGAKKLTQTSSSSEIGIAGNKELKRPGSSLGATGDMYGMSPIRRTSDQQSTKLKPSKNLKSQKSMVQTPSSKLLGTSKPTGTNNTTCGLPKGPLISLKKTAT